MIQFIKKTPFHLALIALAGIIVYSNTIQNPFLFDDTVFVVNNPTIKDFSFFSDQDKVKEVSQQYLPSLENYFKTRYITFATFAFNYAVHGDHVSGYHIVNIAIHILNAFLVYALIGLTCKTPFLRDNSVNEYKDYIRFFSAMLFLCHPIQTQAVTYIWQRSTSLATLFYLVSLVLYIRSRNTIAEAPAPRAIKPLAYYAGSLLSAVLAMKTKEIAFTLPVVIALYELLFFQDTPAKRMRYLIPVFLTMVIIPLSILGTDASFANILGDVSSSTRVMSDISRNDYLLTQCRVIVTYLRLIFWPAGQNIDYDYPLFRSFLIPEVFLSFLFLAALFVAAVFLLVRLRHKAPVSRLIAFGIFWFFIALSVESSVIPIIDLIFEHRVYLPSIGIFTASVTAAFLFAKTVQHRSNHLLKATALFLSAAVLIFSFTAYKRNLVWRSEVALWEDSASKSPNKARVLNNLGVAYQKNNQIQKAAEMYHRAISVDPPYTYAFYNLGYLYSMLGDNIQGNYHLGLFYFSEGQVERAIDNFTKAIAMKQDYAEAYYYRGQIYYVIGQYEKAKTDFQTSCDLGIEHGCKGLNTIKN